MSMLHVCVTIYVSDVMVLVVLSTSHGGSFSFFQARSEAVTNMQARFSFNSKAAQETYAEAWDKRDPWRMLKKNVSFAAPRQPTKVG